MDGGGGEEGRGGESWRRRRKGGKTECGERDLVSLDEVPGPQDVHLEHAVNCWHSVLLEHL